MAVKLSAAPAALLFLASCSGPALDVRTTPPPEHLLVRGIVVYPILFSWPEPAVRSVELAQRQVAVIVADGRLVPIAPTEVTLRGPWDDDPYRASDAAHRLFAQGVKPDEGVVFRLTADQEIARSTRSAMDARGRRVRARSTEERVVKVSLEVVHAPSRRRLYVIESRAPVDALDNDRSEFDPEPELTDLVERVTREALKRLRADELAPERKVALPFSWAFSPVASFAYTPDDRPSFAAELARLDPLTGELRAAQHVHFAAPRADDATLARLARIGDGTLLVTSAPSAADGVRPGDRIVRAGGEPVTGPQVLLRQLLRAGPGTRLLLDVDRGGAALHASIAVPR